MDWALRSAGGVPYIQTMAHTPAWRTFRRAQDLTVATAGLIYAGAVVHAFNRLPGGSDLVVQRALLWPAMFLVLSLALPLLIGPIKRPLARYVWTSFKAGFGQTVGSVLTGVLLLGGAAAFMYWQIDGAAHGGRYPAGLFSGYGAGIGILAAQAILVRVLEADPLARKEIEIPEG